MSRRKHKGPPRCRDCEAAVAFFLSPYTGRWRTFDPRPVDVRHGLLRERAYPVEGRRAWKYLELVEDLMGRRGIGRDAAETEARDMPWHVPHDCPNRPDDDEPEGAPSR